MYAELQRLVEQSQAELVELIATRQREAERHAQEMARGLENELSQLKRRSNELDAHAQNQDKIIFLQVKHTRGSHVGGHNNQETMLKAMKLYELILRKKYIDALALTLMITVIINLKTSI